MNLSRSRLLNITNEEEQHFKKTEKQKDAINVLVSTSRHIALFGGSRSGKTFILVYAIIVRACKLRSRHVILRKTFNSIKTSIWMDTLPKVMSLCFPKLTFEQNKSDYFYTLPNKSEIWVAGLDDDKRAEKILGKEYSTIYFNECSQIEYNSIQIALTRLAEKNALKKKAYYDFNPPSKRHWSYWLFIKKLDPIETIPLQKPDNYVSLRINPVDNIENIDEEYLDMLKALPEKDRQRFLEGLFTDADDGLVYYSFDNDKHIGETQLTHGTIFICMDFNVNPMTACVMQYIDKKFIIHDEIYLKNSDTYRMTQELLRKKYQGTIIPDSTGANRKTSGKSDFEILKDAGFRIHPTRNPFVSDRTNNVNRIFQENRIIINKKCKYLINDLNKVAWKDNKLDAGVDKMLTHISDALGYGLWALDPIGQIKNTMRVNYYT